MVVGYEERPSESGLTNLYTVRLRRDQRVFNILKGYENIERNIVSLKKNIGHEIMLAKDQLRLDIKKYCYRGQ